MTTFKDGPAKGQVLSLGRSPVFLRVVHSPNKWDALDRFEDEPAADETIYVYVRIEKEPGHCHINRGRKGGGFYSMASYRFFSEQPPETQ